MKDRLSVTTDRYLTQQSELLDSTLDTGALAELARPILVGRRRLPGIKLHDDRVIRLLDTLLYNGGLLADWTSGDAHARLLERHRLKESDSTISQLRYDLRKLRAHGLAQRMGRTRLELRVSMQRSLDSRLSTLDSPHHLGAVPAYGARNAASGGLRG